MEIIHLSDLHIGAGQCEYDNTIKVCDWIAKKHAGKIVLITGDLTDSATRDQYVSTKSVLAQLGQTNPILAVPGNHDYAWLGNVLKKDGFELWNQFLGMPFGWHSTASSWMGEDGLGVWIHGNIAFIGIDSGDPNDKQISARGYISQKLADSLAYELQILKDMTRIVFLHHHPFTDGLFTKLHGADHLMEALKDQCEILLFGHEHEYGLWRNQHGIPLIVSSHKTSKTMFSNILMVTIVGINLTHKLEVVNG